MTQKLKIDFVSDVVCPWCAIGLSALQTAAQRVAPDVEVELHFQPFELNPQMGPEGQDIDEHLQQKYGSTPEQARGAREMIRERGQSVGFEFNMGLRSRIYNTFDAHRLIHWAGLEGRQLELKRTLLSAYFTDGKNPSDHDTLVTAAQSAGLDADRARAILASEEYADEVREHEAFYTGHGIRSVPSIIINDQHLISGGQPVEVFEQALRQIAAAQA